MMLCVRMSLFPAARVQPLALWPYAERDDDRPGSARKKNVIFADGSNAEPMIFSLN